MLGAGTMGSGIAISLATGGIAVTLVDAKQEALDAGLARVRSSIDAAERKGRLDAAAAAAARGRVQGSLTLAAVAGADLVVEAVFENLAVKREVFGRLGELARPGTVLATNTSTLDVDAIAAASGRPADVVGMHFFSPANVMRLVEVVRGPRFLARGAGDGAGRHEAHRQDRDPGRQRVRLRRQPDAVRLRPREGTDAARGRESRGHRQGPAGLRHGDGAECRRRPRRPRHRLPGPQGMAGQARRPALLPRLGPARGARPLRPEDRAAASIATTGRAASARRTRKSPG